MTITITIDKEKLAASAHDMLFLLAKAGQTIAINSPLLFDDQGRMLGEICDMLNHVGGASFADACAEDASVAAPPGFPFGRRPGAKKKAAKR